MSQSEREKWKYWFSWSIFNLCWRNFFSQIKNPSRQFKLPKVSACSLGKQHLVRDSIPALFCAVVPNLLFGPKLSFVFTATSFTFSLLWVFCARPEYSWYSSGAQSPRTWQRINRERYQTDKMSHQGFVMVRERSVHLKCPPPPPTFSPIVASNLCRPRPGDWWREAPDRLSPAQETAVGPTEAAGTGSRTQGNVYRAGGGGGAGWMKRKVGRGGGVSEECQGGEVGGHGEGLLMSRETFLCWRLLHGRQSLLNTNPWDPGSAGRGGGGEGGGGEGGGPFSSPARRVGLLSQQKIRKTLRRWRGWLIQLTGSLTYCHLSSHCLKIKSI